MVKFVKFFFDDEQEIYISCFFGHSYVCNRTFGF